jgi:hypothetical protein
MIRRLAAVVALAAALGGCSSGGGGGDDRPDAVGSSTTTTSTPASASTSSSTSRGAAAADATPTGITVTLVANRLIVGGNALVFGAPEFQVRSYLERALLEPVDEGVQDCGPGRLTSIEWRDVTVYLDETEQLVGWYVRTPAFETDAGIGVGATRTAVERAYPGAQISETTLGTELWVPLEGQGDVAGLSGVFDEDGELTALWSGATCVAR